MKNLLISALLFVLMKAAALAGSGGPDAFGYTWKDSAAVGGPAYEWVDLTDGELVLNADHGTPGRVVVVPRPIVFYGEVNDQVMMVSKNGYVTFSVADLGDDPTNDCPFPAFPNKDSARRIAVLHDNLDFKDSLVNSLNGRIEQQYFPTSPHPHHSCGVTVISWLNMVHAGSSQAFDFQLLLFDNFDILMQFGESPENGSGSTTGLQQSGSAGVVVACDSAGSIPDNFAVLFEPPTITVNSTFDDTSAGVTTLRSALLSGGAGSKIVFDASLNGASILRDPARERLGAGRADAVSIDASALAGGVTIDGGGEAQLYLAEGRTHFSNLNFINGSKAAEPTEACGVQVNPAPFLNDRASVTISDCRFRGNVGSGNGGGLLIASGGDVTTYGSAFEDNAVDFGSGIKVDFGGALVAEQCEFRGNSAITGAGINSGGFTILVGCEFEGNSAVYGAGLSLFDDGGGATAISGTVDSCLFRENETTSPVGRGSAVSVGSVDGVAPPVITIVNTTFSGNLGNRGAFGIRDGAARLDHCTFDGNEDAGIFLEATPTDLGQGTASVGHCLFSGVPIEKMVGSGEATSRGFNVAELASAELDHAEDQTSVGALDLSPLGSNGGPVPTHALLPGSVAIDAGNPSITGEPETDARGFDRTVGTIDVGAVEYTGNLMVTTAVDEEVTPGTGLSLREAVRDADSGTVVTFDSSLDGATIALGGSAITIRDDIAVDASSLPDGIEIDAGGNSGVLVVTDASSVSLINLDLINGGNTGGSNGGSGLRVQTRSDVSFIDGSVRGCSGDRPGGGIAVIAESSLWLVASQVTGNETTGSDVDGGGIYLLQSDLEAQRSTISKNVSSGEGGGIRAVGESDVAVSRCTIARNAAVDDGGGISCDESRGEVRNSTISGNSTGGAGGGFDGFNSEIAFEYCTIADNRAASIAGGITAGSFRESWHPTLTHCIVAANQLVGTGLMNIRAFDQDAEPRSEGYNLIDDDSWTNGGSTDLEGRVAYLAPLANYGSDLKTHALLAISPAINAGDPTPKDAPGRDQRGFARIAEGRVDIGAHEAAAPVRVATLVDDLDGVAPRSLRDALLDVGEGGRIVFNGSLNGGVIDLSAAAGGQGAQLVVDKSIQIDATRLSDGITISGGDESRVFDVTGGADVAMHALRIEDGFTGASADGGGFRIGGNADLLLTHSSVSGNRARDGGAFYITGGASARLVNVTVSGNTAQREGATVKLVGGASSVTLEHCSVVDQMLAGAGTVGGFSLGAGKLSLYSTVIATTPGALLSSDDFSNITSLGYNLTDDNGALIGGVLVGAGDQTGVNPNLNVLEDIGGWSKVHRYQASSALRNAGDPEPSLLPALSSTGGVRSVGRMDIGAEERNGLSIDGDNDQMPDYWENLYGFDLDDAMDAAEDADGDGDSNLTEFQNGTNPVQSLSAPVPPIVVSYEDDTAIIYITLKTQPGVRYLAEESEDLIHWSSPASFWGSLNQTTTTYLLSMAGDRRFVRFSLSPEQD